MRGSLCEIVFSSRLLKNWGRSARGPKYVWGPPESFRGLPPSPLLPVGPPRHRADRAAGTVRRVLDEGEGQPVRRADLEPRRESLGVDPDARISGPGAVGVHQALDVRGLDPAEDAGDYLPDALLAHPGRRDGGNFTYQRSDLARSNACSRIALGIG